MLERPPSQTEADIREALERVIRKLPIQPQQQYKVPGIVHGLAFLAGKQYIRPSNRFRRASSKAARAELVRISKLSRRLASTLSTVHEPTTAAIADAGFDVASLVRIFSQLATLSEALTVVGGLQGPARGRPPNLLAEGVRDMLANVYEDLTGTAPARITDPISNEPKGKFYEFVLEIFQILGIERSAEDAVRTRTKKQKRQKF